MKLNNINSYQLFQLMRFGALLLISIFLAKSTLSQAEIGIYETLLFLSGAVSFFWVSGLMQGLLPLYREESEGGKGRLIFQSFLLLFIINTFICGLLLAGQQAVINMLTPDGYLPHYALFILYIWLNNPTFLIEYVFLLKEQKHKMLVYGILIFLFQVLAVVIPVWLTGDILYGLIGLNVFALFKWIFLLNILSGTSISLFDKKTMNQYLLLSAPLIGSLLISNSSEYIDGFIITHYFDREAFAIFRYGARELPFTYLLASAMSVALIPEISSDVEKGMKELKRKTKQLSHILFPVSIVLLILSKWLYQWVFNPDFKESALIFNIYLLLIISRFLMPQTILTGLKKTRLLLYSSIIEILINVSLSLLWVQQFGMIGVAYATLVAFLADKLFLMTYVKFSLGIPVSGYLDLRWHLLYSVALLTLFLIITF